jgi:hypothetical protein
LVVAQLSAALCVPLLDAQSSVFDYANWYLNALLQ